MKKNNKKTINKNLPLPYNMKYKWEECFAKIILERIVSKKYRYLNNSDKPDFQSNKLNIGIEVTSSVNKDSQEMDRLYSNLSYGLVREEKKVIKKIEKMGGKIVNGVLLQPGRTRTLENIYNSVKEKLQLLNGGEYRIFKSNYIFVFDANVILEMEINEIINRLILIQKEYNHVFNKIFIYLFGNNLYDIDLDEKKYVIYDLSSTNINEMSIEARDIVEKYEMNT